MCYDAKSSMNGFLIGGAASLYLLFFSNDPTYKHLGFFFIFVVLMQLLEYFIWLDQDCDKNYNDIASRFIVPVLNAQVLAIILGAYILNTTILPRYVLKYASLFVFVNLLYVCIYTFYIDNREFCTKPNEDGRLQWDKYPDLVSRYGELGYSLVFVLIPFLLKNIKLGILLLIIGGYSLINTQYGNKHSWNSKWCFYAAYIPTLFAVINLLEKYSGKKFPFI